MDGQTWAWIGGMSIFAGTENPDAAYEAFMDLSQATHEWKVPAPRESLATKEGIVAATPYKEVSADNIVANMPHMRAARYYPGYSQWATVYGERFVRCAAVGRFEGANSIAGIERSVTCGSARE